jgi:alanyl-tRNA synthetase
MHWTTDRIRSTFLEFFSSKAHDIVASDPIVIKNDPTLMFTNAGMNQFKGIFVGNEASASKRVCDSQKCLRVSGKHNDLEEVGRDHYHHTMFEMLGNWSFGDYFKKEAIDWAWELLTEVYGLDKDRLYVSIFQGDDSLKLGIDEEARILWSQHVESDRILEFDRKDNFWEMGEIGPCGPCSEIHYDMRPEADRLVKNGAELVNMDHPEVIEIWNLVFMQYNSLESGQLEPLKAKHIDTGMGLERLSRILQGKSSNYDIDSFRALIETIEQSTSMDYTGTDSDVDMAFRVIADHVRAVSFAIADGQLPSNTGAGYVIRRVLRRAIRYGYSFLNMDSPFIHQVCEKLISDMGTQYPELKRNEELIQKVVQEEERGFLSTLAKGLDRLETYLTSKPKMISGTFAFEMYDTYGFPIDLTALIAEERSVGIDMVEFEQELKEQKNRSRNASKLEMGDWTILDSGENSLFIGYDDLNTEARIMKYRSVKLKGKEVFQYVLDRTTFYAESGGQVGDKGQLLFANGAISIFDCKKENGEIVHYSGQLPINVEAALEARVDFKKRLETTKNHSATHLLHHVLRQRLGSHVEQKGSFVSSDKLRFDFSHFEKISEELLNQIESEVRDLISKEISLEEMRAVPITKAKEMGAMALFGEKYGNSVRVIKFGDSIELCGGTHIDSTDKIGGFKILSEASIASGIRRIEAITGHEYNSLVNERLSSLEAIERMLGTTIDAVGSVEKLMSELKAAKVELGAFQLGKMNETQKVLTEKLATTSGPRILIERVDDIGAKELKDLVHSLVSSYPDGAVVLGGVVSDKPSIVVGLGKELLEESDLNASTIIKVVSTHIDGGGGGQAFLASAGGKNKKGLDRALDNAKEIIESA